MSGASVRPDIAFAATVRARRLRFEAPPRTEVSFPGSPGRRSVSRSERRNLPQSVREGVEYEDVRVDYLLSTRVRRDRDGEPE